MADKSYNLPQLQQGYSREIAEKMVRWLQKSVDASYKECHDQKGRQEKERIDKIKPNLIAVLRRLLKQIKFYQIVDEAIKIS
jgi:hypothetical protein